MVRARFAAGYSTKLWLPIGGVLIGLLVPGFVSAEDARSGSTVDSPPPFISLSVESPSKNGPSNPSSIHNSTVQIVHGSRQPRLLITDAKVNAGSSRVLGGSQAVAVSAEISSSSELHVVASYSNPTPPLLGISLPGTIPAYAPFSGQILPPDPLPFQISPRETVRESSLALDYPLD